MSNSGILGVLVGTIVVGLGLFGIASQATAGDGVLEISQACAVNTGCFTGDGPGLPVTIDGSAGRSYRLTSDLVVPSASANAVNVIAPSISIDLNGFEITTTACVGTALDCTPGPSFGAGVSSLFTGTSVRNGTIRGMGVGVTVGENGEVSDLRVRWNYAFGVFGYSGTKVTNVAAFQNGEDIVTADTRLPDGRRIINHACAFYVGCFPGDSAGYPVTIDGSAGKSYALSSDLIIPDVNTDGITINERSVSIDLNGFEIIGAGCKASPSQQCVPASGTGVGVRAAINMDGASVHDGSVTGMGAAGVVVQEDSRVSDIRARWNGGDGINVFRGSIVTGCTSHQNGGAGIASDGNAQVVGNSARGNTGDGIRVIAGGLVAGNSIGANSGYGIYALYPTTGYRANVIEGLAGGTVYQATDLGNNLCNFLPTCP